MNRFLLEFLCPKYLCFFMFSIQALICSQLSAQDHHDEIQIKLQDLESKVLWLKVDIQKDSTNPINLENDSIYLWNEDEWGYRYYAIGIPERRENLWVGVGHAENIEQDYLIVGVRNLGFQFGQNFGKNLVENFFLNQTHNPGVVTDNGFGIYPERMVTIKNIPGVKYIRSWPSFFELGSNNYLLQIVLENNKFSLKEFSEKNLRIFGDGKIEIKLSR